MLQLADRLAAILRAAMLAEKLQNLRGGRVLKLRIGVLHDPGCLIEP
jgi:hypothetical protein